MEVQWWRSRGGGHGCRPHGLTGRPVCVLRFLVGRLVQTVFFSVFFLFVIYADMRVVRPLPV